MPSSHRSPWRRPLAAVVLVLALVTAACGNSGDDSSASDDTSAPQTTAGGGDGGPVDAPGVTDTEIHFSAFGTDSNNPLGTCNLSCFADGIRAYFAFRNDEGGIDGRQLVLDDPIDDELSNNQARALEIVAADDTFATFSAAQVASGWGDISDAGIPLYVWAIQPNEMAGKDNIFGNREPVCLTCTGRWIAFAAEQAGAHHVASLGYGVSESSQQCAQANASTIERYGEDVGGVDVSYLNDDLAFGLPNGIGPEVTAMVDAGTDFIVACIDLNGMKSLAQELERQGVRDDITLLHPNTYDQAFVADAGDLFVGDYVSVAFRPFEADPGNSGLQDYFDWMDQTGAELSEPAMVGWINADLAYQGLVAAGEGFSRQAVIDATNQLTDYSANGLIQPIDWTRQHNPPTEDDLTNAAAMDCQALVQVNADAEFEVVGDPAAPFNCWPGDTRDWSEPTSESFDG